MKHAINPIHIAAAAALLLLAGCGDKTAPVAEKPAAPVAKGKATAAIDPMSVALAPDLAALVKLGPLPSTEIAETLRIAGRLEVNAYKTARIGAPVTGRVSDIRAVHGQDVRLGETLADLASQEVTAAQLAFLKAHSAEQLNARAVERARSGDGHDRCRDLCGAQHDPARDGGAGARVAARSRVPVDLDRPGRSLERGKCRRASGIGAIRGSRLAGDVCR